MPNDAQNNILITRDGQACLGDFGITGSFPCFNIWVYELTSLRYMAPECLSLELGRRQPSRCSKESDVYSLAMTSFSVRSSGVNHPSPQYNHPLTIRSSRVYCHMTAVTTTRSTVMSKTVHGRPAQQTRVRPNGCRTPYGMRSQLLGTKYQNSGANHLSCTGRS